MFPVRAVNQILIEPLCKSVDGCAKMPGAWPIIRASLRALLQILFCHVPRPTRNGRVPAFPEENEPAKRAFSHMN
jgi:hypothetical protein